MGPFDQRGLDELVHDYVIPAFYLVYGADERSVRQRTRLQEEGRQVGQIVSAAARLAALGREPTNGALSRASGMKRGQIDRFFRRNELTHLPASLLCNGVEQALFAEPSALYYKSWVEPARGPDKDGVDHPAPPNIPAAQRLGELGGCANAKGATAHAYAVGICGGRAVVCGDVGLSEGWWDPERWTRLPPHMRSEAAEIRWQLGRHTGLRGPYEPITTTRQITSELTGQLLHLRDGFQWDSLKLRHTVVQSGWIRSGFGGDLGGHGSRLRFLGSDLDSLRYLDRSDLTPLLDLPQDAHALRGRGGYPTLHWDLPWEFRVNGRNVDGAALQHDLERRVDGKPSPSWWRSPDRVAVIALDIGRRCRYHQLRCLARPKGGGDWMAISLLVRRDQQNRWSGWVTTEDLGDPVVQGKLIREAELDVTRHASDGVLERTMSALLEDGYAQRTKRRKHGERKAFAGIAITARTLLDLLR